MQRIANRSYTYLFTSFKIVLSKKFKANFFDYIGFAQQIFLLAINKIYLIKKCSKSFQPLYAKIEKIRIRILPYILLLSISAMLIKAKQLQIFDINEFYDNYILMQISLD